jgi:hypothetical protein
MGVMNGRRLLVGRHLEAGMWVPRVSWLGLPTCHPPPPPKFESSADNSNTSIPLARGTLGGEYR